MVITGLQPRFETLEATDESPAISDDIVLSSPQQDCTRHIEADWNGVPDRILLCIRYRGRRIGSINPAHADHAFWQASKGPVSEGEKNESKFGPAHECRLEDLVVNQRLVTPGRSDPEMAVVVHSKGTLTLRYAATAWYTDLCKVVLVDGNLRDALAYGKEYYGFRDRPFVALIG